MNPDSDKPPTHHGPRIHGRYDLPVVVLITAALTLPTTCYLGSISREYWNEIYSKAQQFAVYEFGDKRPPLTTTELQEWHISIGGNSKQNVKKYLDDHLATQPSQ